MSDFKYCKHCGRQMTMDWGEVVFCGAIVFAGGSVALMFWLLLMKATIYCFMGWGRWF